MEYHKINRKWVLMRSKADYDDTMETLQIYAKRGDMQEANQQVKSNKESKE